MGDGNLLLRRLSIFASDVGNVSFGIFCSRRFFAPINSIAAQIANHIQFARLRMRGVLKTAFCINVSGPKIGGIDGKPYFFKAQSGGRVNAAPRQFGADADVLESRPDHNEHFALALVDGK